ncbi:hypothetical protein ACWD00_28375, partial [Streptomyces viridiviolaceus]
MTAGPTSSPATRPDDGTGRLIGASGRNAGNAPPPHDAFTRDGHKNAITRQAPTPKPWPCHGTHSLGPRRPTGTDGRNAGNAPPPHDAFTRDGHKNAITRQAPTPK